MPNTWIGTAGGKPWGGWDPDDGGWPDENPKPALREDQEKE